MKQLLGVLLGMILSPLIAAQSMEMYLNAADTSFQVILPSNPSTGYQWTVQEYDKTLFSLISSQYIPPISKLVGAPGNMGFVFQRNKGVPVPKMTKIVFLNARSWEKDKGTLETLTVTFQE